MSRIELHGAEGAAVSDKNKKWKHRMRRWCPQGIAKDDKQYSVFHLQPNAVYILYGSLYGHILAIMRSHGILDGTFFAWFAPFSFSVSLCEGNSPPAQRNTFLLDCTTQTI